MNLRGLEPDEPARFRKYSLMDLRSPPANRLEALKGHLKSKYSIRINDQYRLVFEFRDGNAYEVEIVDSVNSFMKNTNE